ncbi:MAG: hypothetical protein AAFW70_26610 [Cyanobacteria bacterium J06635_10]
MSGRAEGAWLEYLWGFKPQPNSRAFERWGIKPIRKKLIKTVSKYYLNYSTVSEAAWDYNS